MPAARGPDRRIGGQCLQEGVRGGLVRVRLRRREAARQEVPEHAGRGIPPLLATGDPLATGTAARADRSDSARKGA